MTVAELKDKLKHYDNNHIIDVSVEEDDMYGDEPIIYLEVHKPESYKLIDAFVINEN